MYVQHKTTTTQRCHDIKSNTQYYVKLQRKKLSEPQNPTLFEFWCHLLRELSQHARCLLSLRQIGVNFVFNSDTDDGGKANILVDLRSREPTHVRLRGSALSGIIHKRITHYLRFFAFYAFFAFVTYTQPQFCVIYNTAKTSCFLNQINCSSQTGAISLLLQASDVPCCWQNYITHRTSCFHHPRSKRFTRFFFFF